MLGIFAIGMRLRHHHRRHRSLGRLGGRPDRRHHRQDLVAGDGGGWATRLRWASPSRWRVAAADRPRPGAAHHPPQAPAVHRHAGRHAADPRRVADDRPGRHAQPRRLAAPRLPTAACFMHDGDPLLPYPLLIFLGGRRASAPTCCTTRCFGRYVYAIGGNRDAAEYSGINVQRVETTDLRHLRRPRRRRRRLLRRLHRPDVAAGRRRLRALRDRGGRARRLLAARRRGHVLGIVIGVGDDAGHRQRHQHVPDRATTTPTASRRIWRLNPNWTFIIVGAVILIAVILDQVVHMVQAARRVRAAPAAPAVPGSASPPADSTPPAPAGSH